MISENFFTWILHFSPSPEFLSDIAAFEGVIMGIAIPLSIDIISRISERYESDVISRHFRERFGTRALTIFLVFNILVAIFLRFFSPEQGHPGSNFWIVLSWSILLLLLFAGFWLIRFFDSLLKYGDSEFVLKELFKDAEEAIRH